MSKQSLLKALQSVENMHEYMAEERTQTIITDIRASIENSTSLRDQFAMAALTGLVMNPLTICPEVPISARAYELADAMLVRRTEQPE